MSDIYVQFSEIINNVPNEAIEWIKHVLQANGEGIGEKEGEDERRQLISELGLNPKSDYDLDDWPYFCWDIEEENNLWLYSEEGFSGDHLIIFIQALAKKFIPNLVFKATFSNYCSKPEIGEFGGGWLVITKDKFESGDTWEEAKKVASRLSSLSEEKK
jgi:hypothetical protein